MYVLHRDYQKEEPRKRVIEWATSTTYDYFHLWESHQKVLFLTNWILTLTRAPPSSGLSKTSEIKEFREFVKIEFEEEYEDVPAYITFGEPYYRVRVGDFRTRLDAEKFLQRIYRTYPNAWVTRDKINLPVLLKYQKNQ